MGERAALFDLDGTLIDCNSARLWVRREWDAGRLSPRDVLWAGWWLGKYALGRADGLEQGFAAAVATLKGEREEEIAARTREWFAAEVAHRLRPGARAAVERHRAAGDRLVIATSSSRYAASEALAAFGFDDLISAEFEVLDGRFTGRVAALAVGDAKLQRASEWAGHVGVDLAECVFYTDSISDLALLARVGHPVAVNPDRALLRAARARGWEVVDWGRSAR